MSANITDKTIEENNAGNDVTGANYVFGVIKDYNHSLGLSVCFRQWSDTSHCRFLHGYALRISLDFVSLSLDSRNWVIPFGGLKDVKQYLVDNFDHKTLVAEDDPELETFQNLHQKGLIDLLVFPRISIESFAKYIYEHIQNWLDDNKDKYGKVVLRRISVSEHEANCGYYENLNWQDELKG